MVPQAGIPPNPDDHESFADFVNRHLGSIRANAPGALPNGDPAAPARQQAVFSPVSNDKSGVQTTHADQVSLQAPTPTPAPLPTTGFTGRLNFSPGSVGGFRPPNTILRDSPLSATIPPGGLNPTGTNQRPGFRYIDTANLPADPRNTGLLEDQSHASDADIAFADFMARHYGAPTVSGGMARNGANPYFSGTVGNLSTRPGAGFGGFGLGSANAYQAYLNSPLAQQNRQQSAESAQEAGFQASGGYDTAPHTGNTQDAGHNAFEAQSRTHGVLDDGVVMIRPGGIYQTVFRRGLGANNPNAYHGYWDQSSGGWM